MAGQRKTPSGAELARREAQSKRDAGEQFLVLEHEGIRVEVKDFSDDFELMSQLNRGNVFPLMEFIWPEYSDMIADLGPLRDEEGRLRTTRVAQWLQGAFEKAVSLGK